MKQIVVGDLLSRYLSKTIRADEWTELKRFVDTTSDEALLSVLEQLWNEKEYKYNDFPEQEILDSIFTAAGKSNRRRSLKPVLHRLMKIAAIFLIPILLGITVYLYQDRQQMMVLGQNEVIINTTKGQKTLITLPDGTTAYLNSESSLRYRQNYGYENRKVNLEGEAFFEVKSDSVKKFIVSTAYINIEVLGTNFNVYAYETGDCIEMTLVSGLVKVVTQAEPIQMVFARPNEKVFYDKQTGNLHLKKTNVRRDTAWMRGELIFRSEPFKSVLSQIECRYGVTIHVDGKLPEADRFTGYFESDRIEDVMTILKMHYSFNYKIIGDNIWIYANN